MNDERWTSPLSGLLIGLGLSVALLLAGVFAYHAGRISTAVDIHETEIEKLKDKMWEREKKLFDAIEHLQRRVDRLSEESSRRKSP